MIKTRKECVICNHDSLTDYYSFNNFPIYMGTSKTKDNYKSQDMKWATCDKCGELQLKSLIKESILYEKTHNASIGKSWVEHNKEFVNFINNECYGKVLDIGGGNLHIANLIASSDKVSEYHIIDSNIFKDNAETNKFVFFEDLFDLSKIEAKQYDFIIHSHTLEHLYDPISDLKQLRRILKPNGRMFFSVPMIDNMLTKGYTNALNFEHTYYLDKNVVELMLNISGFNIERDYFISTDEIKDWCLFASCSVGNQKEIAIEKNLKGVKYFQQFLNINNNIISDLNKKLKKYKNAKKFIFGAHIFTQFLLNFGLKNDFLYVLDNDKNKQEEFLYGENLIVKSPKILSEYENPIVILKACQYNEEIKQDILKNINNNTIFLE